MGRRRAGPRAPLLLIAVLPAVAASARAEVSAAVRLVLVLERDGSARATSVEHDPGSAADGRPLPPPPPDPGWALLPAPGAVAAAGLALDDWHLALPGDAAPPPRPPGWWEVLCPLRDGGGAALRQAFADPRRVVEEGPDGHDGRMAGAAARRKAVWPLRIPSGACSHLLVAAPGGRQKTVPIPRAARAEQNTAVSHGSPQRVGPVASVSNLVLISGGYLASQQSRFDTDVENVVRLFKQPPAAFASTVPFTRYFDTVNVFSVFQASSAQGASAPAKGVSVNDNLKCAYGDTNPNALFCDTELMLALGDTAPAKPRTNMQNSVVVALVNSPDYGGGGLYSAKFRGGAFFNGFNLASESNRTRFASLLFHELGHAWSDLMDEYDMRINEPTDRDLANCLSPQKYSTGTVPWQGWIDKWVAGSATLAATEQLDTVAGMQQPCGYTNYYRPSSSTKTEANYCLMEKLNGPRMCPVCREHVTLKMYQHSSRSALLWPSCPLPDDIVYVERARTTPIFLYTNHRLASKGELEVKWELGTRSLCTAAGAACATVALAASDLAAGDNTVTLTVTDNTAWVLPARRNANMTQSHAITIRLVDSVGALDNSSGGLLQRTCFCQPGSGSGCRDSTFFLPPSATDAGYVGGCRSGGQCDLDFSSTAYEQPTEIGQDLEQFSDVVLYTGIGLGIAALIPWAAMWRKYKAGARVNPIFRVQWKAKFMAIRIAMMGTALIIMLASFGILVISLWMYTKMSGLAKWILVPGGLVCLILYTIAFVGFWATWMRSTCWLIVNGVLLFLSCGVCGAVAYFAKWFHDSVGSQDHSAATFLIDTWEYLVKDRPGETCKIQDMLECSGYEESCRRVPSTLQCPTDCDVTNGKYSDGCRKKIDDFIEEYFPTVFLVAILVGVALLVGLIFNFTLIWALRGMAHEAKKRTDQRIAALEKSAAAPGGAAGDRLTDVKKFPTIYLLQNLDDKERDSLVRQFDKWNQRGDDVIKRDEVAPFFKRIFGKKPGKDEVDEIMKCGDPDDTGKVRFRDLCAALSNNRDWSPPAARRKSSAGFSLRRQSTPGALTRAPGPQPTPAVEEPPEAEEALLSRSRRGSIAQAFASRHNLRVVSPPPEQIVSPDAQTDNAQYTAQEVLPMQPLPARAPAPALAPAPVQRQPSLPVQPAPQREEAPWTEERPWAEWSPASGVTGRTVSPLPAEYSDDPQLPIHERERRARLRQAWSHGQDRGARVAAAYEHGVRSAAANGPAPFPPQPQGAAGPRSEADVLAVPPPWSSGVRSQRLRTQSAGALMSPAAAAAPLPPEYRDDPGLGPDERARRTRLRAAFHHGQSEGTTRSPTTAASPRQITFADVTSGGNTDLSQTARTVSDLRSGHWQVQGRGRGRGRPLAPSSTASPLSGNPAGGRVRAPPPVRHTVVPRPGQGLGLECELDERGIYVRSVTPGGPADAAGLAPGAIVIALGGHTVSSLAELERAAASAQQSGQPFHIDVAADASPRAPASFAAAAGAPDAAQQSAWFGGHSAAQPQHQMRWAGTGRGRISPSHVQLGPTQLSPAQLSGWIPAPGPPPSAAPPVGSYIL